MLHFGIRDQNLELKIGISDEKIYLVTTLKYERKNEKDSGRSSNTTSLCKWRILHRVHTDFRVQNSRLFSKTIIYFYRLKVSNR